MGSMDVLDLRRARERLRRHAPSEGGPTGEGGPTAQAAVATILRNGDSGLDALLIERARRAGDPWSGQLAFPGGKRDPGDESLLATAVRETREEIALELEPAACLARLGDVVARTRDTRVAQFVFALDDGAARIAVPNDEVTAILWVPLARLAASEAHATFALSTVQGTVETPCVRLDERVLWGMTYRMAQQLIQALAGV